MKLSEQLLSWERLVSLLPASSRRYALLWQQGHDVRSFVPRSTFYRQAAIFLQHGVDITKPCDRSKFPPSVCFLGVSKVAQHLRISESRVLRLLYRGRIPGYKVGKRWRVKVPFTVKPGIRDSDLSRLPVLSMSIADCYSVTNVD